MASKVFYVRGFPKSGTNWVCNLLNLHPSICCKGEFQLGHLFDSMRMIRDGRFSILRKDTGPQTLEAAFGKMVKSLVVETCDRAKVCGDRTPFTLRRTFLPGVPNVYIYRDGRDVAVSWMFHALNENLDEREEMQRKVTLHRSDPEYFEKNKTELLSCEDALRDLSNHWNRSILDDFAMMREADRGDIDLPYLCVRYEDLRLDPERHRMEMYQFLGLKPKLAGEMTWVTKPGFGNRGEINRPNRFYRRGQAGTWREYFSDRQLNWFMDEASDAMELLHYE